MRKQKPLTPYEKPMALRRSFIVFVVVIGGLFLVRALTSSAVPPLGELSPQQLATSMGNALLHVHDMTFSVAGQRDAQGQSITADASISVERNGNFQISGQSEQNPAQRGEIRVIGGTLYFHYSKSVIYRILSVVPQGISNSQALADAAALGNRWFTTGDVATATNDAPPTPKTVRGLFSSLGITKWMKFSKQVSTTNQGVTVVPLLTGDVTWFVPATGARLPNAIAFDNVAVDANPIAFLANGPTVEVSYRHVTISTPAHVTNLPAHFAAQWNQGLPAQRIATLNSYGLLWLALTPHP
jgi:hypothetical protein